MATKGGVKPTIDMVKSQIRRRSKVSNVDLESTLISGRFKVDWDRGRGAYASTPPTMAELQRAWNQARDKLLPEFIDKFPGTRPWAWWKFDQPGPTWSEMQWPLHVDSNVVSRDRNAPDQARQTAFLDKHGLLTPTEREALELNAR